QTAGRYDGEGRFWSARDAVERSGLGPFAELSLVVVDGFTDFTHTQYELLAHIGNSSQQMRISLPLELPLKRSGLFAKSQTALTRLQAIFAEDATVRSEFPQPTTASQLPAVAHLSANLFDNPRHVERLPHADGIELLATAGPIREMEVIALRVKQLLLAGSVPAEIVVAFRSLEESAELLREIFTAAGIPFQCEAGFLLSRSRVLKALFDVVRLECEDWPFERLLAVLRSNFFRPDWDVFKNERAVSALAAQLRNRKLHTQRTVMLRVLRREKTRLESNPDETDPDEFESISLACELLEQLSSATQRLRGETDFRGWCERVLQLGRELGIASDETDAQTWGDFERILFDAAKTDEFSPAPARKMKLAEFHQAVSEMIEGHELPQPEESRRCVRILDAGSVRNLDVPHLLLGGLTEANYPRSRADDCLYGEMERRTLNEQGLTLRQRSAHEEDELLLFYGVLTRARKSLTLTFPEMGVNGQPLFPSPYLKAIESLFEPGAVAVEQVGQLDPVPPRASVSSDSDLRRVSTAEVGNGSSGLFAAMCRQPQMQPAAENILASVDANCARFQTRGWTDYEGRLFDVDLRARVAGRFPADHQFSATQLESYASCGFRFFMSDVLRISPLETPQAGTDYLRRGVLVHRVLSLLHAESSAEESDDAKPIDVENDAAAMSGEFRRQVDDLSGRRIDETELLKALTEVERRLLHDWADIYSEQWEQYQSGFSQTWDAAPRPMQLEAAFGDVPGEPNESAAGEEAAVI
ncbi:MAG: PD-(D/E)XK nuclease family protein, partial [Planctomycetes bacterium]|nr:PD-(D/E)XK nuclease family protein [Planctomycetota bacterium]